jgi:AcrR family transcriptional regulator
MVGRKKKEPKQRILDAAISLFAQKGFAAVGVREIARVADVNIAMISYYYKGKVGILRSIIQEYFNRCDRVLDDIDLENMSAEDTVRELIGRIIDFIRKNHDLAMVMYNELPLDIPEVTEIKADRMTAMVFRIDGLIRRFGMDPNDLYHLSMIGPSLMGMIFTNFRIRPVLKYAFKVKIDEAYYTQLKDTLSTLFLSGVTGLVTKVKSKEGEQDEING